MPAKSRPAAASPGAEAARTDAVSQAPASAGASGASGLDPSGMRGNAFAAEQIAARQTGSGGAGLPTTKAQAVDRQAKGRSVMTRIIDSAKSIEPDPTNPDGRAAMLRNSAEWVTSGEIRLEVLAPLHDGARRGVPAGMVGYYGVGTPYTATPPAYNETSRTLDATMTTDFANTKAITDETGTAIQFFDPSKRSEGDLVTSLIHEIQHDADHHNDVTQPSTFSLTTADPSLYALAASEFRAYAMQNEEGSVKDRFGSSTAAAPSSFPIRYTDAGDGTLKSYDASGLKNERQARILMQLTRESKGLNGAKAPGTALTPSDFDGPYGFVVHYYVHDPAFRTFVNLYDTPSSVNSVNSVRLEALYDALIARDMDKIGDALGKLDQVDLAALQDFAKSSPMWKAAFAADPRVGAVLGMALMGQATAATDVTVTAQRGDTLKAIALRMIGDADYALDIREANDGVTLPRRDTDPLTAGTKLKIPSDKL